MNMRIENDLSATTSIPISSIQKLLDRYQDILCYYLQSQLNTSNEYYELDIYIGTLLLKVVDNNLIYKFIPSTRFEKELVETLTTKESPLVTKLEQAVTDRIMDAYKEFI